MKKVLFLKILLFLMILGTASVKSQVRIGGNAEPNKAAILDLNVDNSSVPAGNKGALALPRISLANDGAALNGVAPLNGMMVYNTNASMTGGNGEGIYYWNAGKWVKFGGITLNVTPELDADYTASATDDIILFTTNSEFRRLYLPTSGIPIGKKLYVSDNGLIGVSLQPNIALRDQSQSVVWPGFPVTIMYVGNGKWMVLDVVY